MKVWNIQISTLSKELQQAVEQFDCFVSKAEGCHIIAEQNEKNPGFSHQDDTLVIRYSSKRQFVYLLFLALAGNKEEMSLTPAFKELTAMLDVAPTSIQKRARYHMDLRFWLKKSPRKSTQNETSIISYVHARQSKHIMIISKKLWQISVKKLYRLKKMIFKMY